jgi:anti-sigma28 factor (negative regulator of flagellin synthesis)
MNGDNSHTPRKRSLTSLTLDWLAEKLRRTERLREEISGGQYKVESEKIAQAILNRDPR